MTQHIVERVKSLYQQLNKNTINSVRDVYANEIEFIDPLHRINGLFSFEQYIAQMYQNVIAIRFEYGDELVNDSVAFLSWRMYFQHAKLNNGKEILLHGSSHLRFEQKIYYHRDYFDAGAMLYEHIPLLGWSIKTIKARLG